VTTALTTPRAARTGTTRLARRRQRIALVMLAPALLGLLLFFVVPLLLSIGFSFTRFDLLSAPQWIGLRNYEYLFTEDPKVWTAAGNTLWFVVILVPARVLSALLIGALLARGRRASGFWRTLFYLPALVPPVAAVVSFVFLFQPGNGPLNRILDALHLPQPLWFNDPALAKPSLVVMGIWVAGDVMIILLAALLDVPTEQYEAAQLDGAGALRRGWYITLPTIAPVIGFAVVTGIIAALQYFTEAAVASTVAQGKATVGEGSSSVLGYPDDSLLTYTQWLYERGFGEYQFGYASALAVLLFVVTAIVLALLMRRFKAFSPEEAAA
jgi:multiple sugar transport system permease protein